jgi:hypothetical protein
VKRFLRPKKQLYIFFIIKSSLAGKSFWNKNKLKNTLNRDQIPPAPSKWSDTGEKYPDLYQPYLCENITTEKNYLKAIEIPLFSHNFFSFSGNIFGHQVKLTF